MFCTEKQKRRHRIWVKSRLVGDVSCSAPSHWLLQDLEAAWRVILKIIRVWYLENGEASARSGSENQTYEHTWGVFGQIIVAMHHCRGANQAWYRLECGQFKNPAGFHLLTIQPTWQPCSSPAVQLMTQLARHVRGQLQEGNYSGAGLVDRTLVFITSPISSRSVCVCVTECVRSYLRFGVSCMRECCSCVHGFAPCVCEHM